MTKNPNKDDDVGDTDLLDITREYKNPEGTEAERLAVYNAVKGVPKAHQYYEIPKETKDDVSFDLIDIDVVPFGQSFDVVVKIDNNSDESRTIGAMLSCASVFYTGATAHDIKKSQGTFTVKAGQKETLKIRVKPEDYLDKLVDHSLIKIYSIANVKETKQTWSEEDDFTLAKPKLEVVAEKTVLRVEEETKVTFAFKNPLDMPLTDCSYSVEGPGLKNAKVKKFRDVKAKEKVSFSEVFSGKKPGERKIVAHFNSKEMQGVDGNATVFINP